MAAGGVQFRGRSVLQYAGQIAKLVKLYDVQSMLDYGCGGGDQYKTPASFHQQIGLKRKSVALYDPSFKGHDKLPDRRFDMVVCSDVLEHIPEDSVDALVDSLFNHANKVVWASVCCRPAKKFFADGTNLHITLKALDWWAEKFTERSAAAGVAFQLVESP